MLFSSGTFRCFTLFGKVVLLIVFLIGLLFLCSKVTKAITLNDIAQIYFANPLDEMNWQDFELLAGKHFHQQGFVTKGTAGGANGGDN